MMYDATGVPSWRPYLLLEDDPEFFPIAKGPVQLNIVVTFGLYVTRTAYY